MVSGSAYRDVFSSVQPVYIFWLLHLIHKLIINIIFLIVSCLFHVGLFLLLCFLPKEYSLAFVVKLARWCWILLTFAHLESFWFLHQIQMRVLLGRVLLVLSFLFITLNISCHSLLACRLSFEKSTYNLMGVSLYVICGLPFLLLLFYLCL